MSNAEHQWGVIQDAPGMLGRLLARVRGSPVEYDLAPYRATVKQINALEPELAALDNTALSARAAQQRQAARAGTALADLLVPAFALVREASRRALGLRPYDEQVAGGLVLHQGKVAEMPTGEGKTLVAVLPAYLHALAGEGVHLLTFNDYLARRDAAWMGPIYELLGLRVGCVQAAMPTAERRAAYAADVTYLTAKEAGFDYLRDGLIHQDSERVQRPYHYAIVDEADSILIDEARIPLVIAGSGAVPLPGAQRMAELVQSFTAGIDYEADSAQRSVSLTEAGLARAEAALASGGLYEPGNALAFTQLNLALHAQALLRRDVDYIVRREAIELVDELTGRVAVDRHWPDGLQAALEAKEHLPPKHEGVILGSITLQHLFALYPLLAGMTGTARPAEDELFTMYGLTVVPIPSHRPCIRIDRPDQVFTHKAAKLNGLVAEIAEAHGRGQPVLVGTASVKESEELAAILQTQGLSGAVLNAKTDELEAQIIAEAGAPGAITISTNMAGRGTDIRLGGANETARDQVVAAGGLYVIGTNRQESRRIDNQLRGRAARQGDPGVTCFFVSLEDDLVVCYGIDNLLPARRRLGQDAVIDDPLVASRIHWAQRVIEGQHGDIRLTLCKYSGLIEQQRGLVRGQREELLEDATSRCAQACPKRHAELLEKLGPERRGAVERQVSVVLLDRLWANHLSAMADLREEIPVIRLGTGDPYHEFLRRASQAFADGIATFDRDLAATLEALVVTEAGVDLERQGIRGPSATWTYLVEDDPFRDALGLRVAGNLALSIGAAVYWPLYLAVALYRRWRGARQPAPLRPE